MRTYPSSLSPVRGRRGATRWILPTVTGMAGIVLGSCLGGGGVSPTASRVSVTVTRTITPNAALPAAVRRSAATQTSGPSLPGDGTYTVGKDIKAGTYRSGTPTSGNCYWARLRSDNGESGDVIENRNSSGESVVKILSSDRLFETSGCAAWVRVK